ncbi:hypothetical protein [Dyella lutea]|uniref:Uncharacterized protein n=1 Tax=Dyella lutea TaxID=2950441 RepID=A0ABT1F9D0_9GAMM|nr:hypothetical protein [Dyella lutea]MCP1373048.1 hypothetical protein [Dyella lutea]
MYDKGWQVPHRIRKSAWWRPRRAVSDRFVAAANCATGHVFAGIPEARDAVRRMREFAIGLTSAMSVDQSFGRKKRGID